MWDMTPPPKKKRLGNTVLEYTEESRSVVLSENYTIKNVLKMLFRMFHHDKKSENKIV